MIRSWSLRIALGLVALALTLAGGAWAGARDPAPILKRYYSPPVRLERRPGPAIGARVQRWLLISARGDSVTALWRPAPAKTKNPWTAVVMGGFGTGDRTALILPQDSLYNTLAVNWPWSGKRRLTPAEFAMKLPAIQRAVLRSPAVLALGVEAVIRTRGVDPSRIVLVGASLGAYPVLAALHITGAPDAVVLVDAGADLETLIRVGLEREGWVPGAAALSAAGAYQWVWPLEPTLNAPAAARLPVLIMNASDDEQIPRSSILKLQQSLPHATVRWRAGPHVRSHPEVVARLARETEAWLRSREAAPAGAAAPSAGLATPR